MWPVDDIELRDVQLDFGSSSGGHIRTQAIYAGDTCLVNAISFAELGNDPTQLMVCEACGTVQCQSGGWVHIRRIGNSVAFIPAFSEMLAGVFELTEFSPPPFTDSLGTPLFSTDLYEHLRICVPTFPEISNLQSITAADAVRLMQWHAPLRILGRFPDQPQIVRDTILAVSDGKLDDELDCVRRSLADNVNSSAKLSVAPQAGSIPIEFHLDGPGFPTWRPLRRLGNKLRLNLEPVGPLTAAAPDAT